MLSTADLAIKLPGQSKKLVAKFIGPYMVKRIISDNAYELELPASLSRLHSKVAGSRGRGVLQM